VSTNSSPASAVVPPHGLDQIIATFGDIFGYIRPDHTLDPRWPAEFLDRATLPFPMKLSWDPSRSVTQFTCHKLLAGIFADVLERIQSAGLEEKVTSFGGCFSFRPQRTGTKLSAHSWGIAIDLNPETNAQGTAGNMDPGIVQIFRDVGFEWGGAWQGRTRDPMHFQFCSGY
jgi:D-alanyl-D-alanine carboxypeptidase-like protein